MHITANALPSTNNAVVLIAVQRADRSTRPSGRPHPGPNRSQRDIRQLASHLRSAPEDQGSPREARQPHSQRGVGLRGPDLPGQCKCE